jgi:hypothetical protein
VSDPIVSELIDHALAVIGLEIRGLTFTTLGDVDIFGVS